MTDRSMQVRIPFAGVLAAVGVILTYVELPLPFMPPFMKIDLSDVPSVLGLFFMGLPTALFITAVKDMIHLLVTESLGIGEVCNFLVTLVYLTALQCALRWGRQAGYAAAVLSMTAVAAFLNAAILLPLYFAAFHMTEAQLLAITRAAGTPAASLADYLLLVVVPFNLIKGSLIAAVSAMLCPRLSHFFSSNP